jgi:hypothetical protein
LLFFRIWVGNLTYIFKDSRHCNIHKLKMCNLGHYLLHHNIYIYIYIFFIRDFLPRKDPLNPLTTEGKLKRLISLRRIGYRWPLVLDKYTNPKAPQTCSNWVLNPWPPITWINEQFSLNPTSQCWSHIWYNLFELYIFIFHIEYDIMDIQVSSVSYFFEQKLHFKK